MSLESSLIVLKFAGVFVSGLGGVIGTLPEKQSKAGQSSWLRRCVKTVRKWALPCAVSGLVVAFVSQLVETAIGAKAAKDAREKDALAIESATAILRELKTQSDNTEQALLQLARLGSTFSVVKAEIDFTISAAHPAVKALLAMREDDFHRENPREKLPGLTIDMRGAFSLRTNWGRLPRSDLRSDLYAFLSWPSAELEFKVPDIASRPTNANLIVRSYEAGQTNPIGYHFTKQLISFSWSFETEKNRWEHHGLPAISLIDLGQAHLRLRMPLRARLDEWTNTVTLRSLVLMLDNTPLVLTNFSAGADSRGLVFDTQLPPAIELFSGTSGSRAVESMRRSIHQ